MAFLCAALQGYDDTRHADGPLVRGTPGIDGNIAFIDEPARRVTACIDFADAEGRKRFQKILERYTW